VGTGSVAYATINDKEYRVGGLGFPHSDEGSGAWLGAQAINFLHNATQPAALLGKLFNYFDNDIHQLTQWKKTATSTQYAAFVPMIVDMAREQDVVAIHLLKTAAKEIEGLQDSLFEKIGRKVPVCLLGGLSSVLKPFLSTTFLQQIVLPQGDAMQGAISIIRKIQG
jgi:glucosamine kinase